MKAGKLIIGIAVLGFLFYAAVIFVNSIQPPQHVHSEDDQSVAQNTAIEIKQLEEMLVGEPKNLRARLRLGHLYLETKQPQKAAGIFEKALSIAPDNPEVQVDLGIAYYQSGQIKKAEQSFLNVTRTFPTYPDAWLQLGIIYRFSLKDTQKALDAWKEYLNLEPDGEYSPEVRRQIEALEQVAKP